MFALFFSLYLSMFRGSWQFNQIADIKTLVIGTFNKMGEFLTSIFNNVSTPLSDLGDTLFTDIGIWNGTATIYYQPWMALSAFILALITSIGIVIMAVKGVKKAFGIFFMGIR